MRLCPHTSSNVGVGSIQRGDTGVSTVMQCSLTHEPGLLTSQPALDGAQWATVGYSGLQCSTHGGPGARQAPRQDGRVGGAPRIPTVTTVAGDSGSLGGSWKRHGSILEAFPTRAREIRARTCAHQRWYWPPPDSARLFPFLQLHLYGPSPIAACPAVA